MSYNDIEKNPYVALRIGVEFFFYENPINCKEEIKEIFNMYCDITKGKFLFHINPDNMIYKSMKSEQKKYFNGIIDRSNFGLARNIIMTDATPEQIQDIKCEMILANHEPGYALKLPNQMYFEFLPSVCYETIVSFIRFMCRKINVHYCCCNSLPGVNDHYRNRSNSNAVKLIQENICLLDRYSVWNNRCFLRKMEKGIDGPNAIQVFSEALYSLIGREKLIGECKSNNLYYEEEKNYIMTAISSHVIPQDDEEFGALYVKLYNVLKDIIIDMKKPQMYWKAEEWVSWKNRFDRKA